MPADNIDKTLERFADEYRDDPEFIASGLASNVTDEVMQILLDRHLTRAWLADEMGVKPARVSSILNAPPNLTLHSIAKLAVALKTPPELLIHTPGRPFVWEPTSEGQLLDRLGTASYWTMSDTGSSYGERVLVEAVSEPS